MAFDGTPTTLAPSALARSAGSVIPPGRIAPAYALAAIVLATALNFMGLSVFGMVIERIKLDLALSDAQLGWLIGPAGILFYMLIGIPLARLVDLHSRKAILALGMVFCTVSAAGGAFAAGFATLFLTRTLVGLGSAVHAPASYSLIGDLFPPRLLPRAIAIFQLGFISGTTLGVYLGGLLLQAALARGPVTILGEAFRPWQQVIVLVAAPGLLAALALMLIREPARQLHPAQSDRPGTADTLRAVWQMRSVLFPLFAGVIFCAIESISLANWRTPFMVRTYGWSEAQIGTFMAPLLFVTAIAGVAIGTILTEWLGRRWPDAPIRASGILFLLATPCAVAYPWMPDGELALTVMALSGMFAMAAAVPQNAALQLVVPHAMRGQMTAVYVFLFTLAGALGTLLIALVGWVGGGHEQDLWRALSETALLLVPLAGYSIGWGLKPYARHVRSAAGLDE